MIKPPLSHYSPKFANRAWVNDDGYMSYFHCPYTNKIKKSPRGWKQWGRKKGLYSWAVENALNVGVEAEASYIYEKISNYIELDNDERFIWSQFLLSQLVRTPTYLRYEKSVREVLGITSKPEHDRVGCRDCGDLNFVANRDWCLLLAHDDDFFVRSDNPVFQTGFIELPSTYLFYPLTPRLCFVACSMLNEWNPFKDKPNVTCAYQLPKGAAHFYNFYLAKAAGESLIISPKHDGVLAEEMYNDILGVYPQPPFSLHRLDIDNIEYAFESIRRIMNYADNAEYPFWQSMELEPFYQRKFDASTAC